MSDPLERNVVVGYWRIALRRSRHLCRGAALDVQIEPVVVRVDVHGVAVLVQDSDFDNLEVFLPVGFPSPGGAAVLALRQNAPR